MSVALLSNRAGELLWRILLSADSVSLRKSVMTQGALPAMHMLCNTRLLGQRAPSRTADHLPVLSCSDSQASGLPRGSVPHGGHFTSPTSHCGRAPAKSTSPEGPSAFSVHLQSLCYMPYIATAQGSCSLGETSSSALRDRRAFFAVMLTSCQATPSDHHGVATHSYCPQNSGMKTTFTVKDLAAGKLVEHRVVR